MSTADLSEVRAARHDPSGHSQARLLPEARGSNRAESGRPFDSMSCPSMASIEDREQQKPALLQNASGDTRPPIVGANRSTVGSSAQSIENGSGR